MWAICLGKFASTSALYFFLTWFPTYLIEERQLTLIKVGIFAVMPFIGATVGILLAGIVSDLLIRKGTRCRSPASCRWWWARCWACRSCW